MLRPQDVQKYIEKKGGFKVAEKDFNSMNLDNVTVFETKYGKAYRGTNKNGETIILRQGSSEGTPTIELQKGKNRIKIRYDE